MPPLVSICMPTLNARAYLEPRVESILGQTFADWEVIVCDSHSSDGTMDFLRRLSGDTRWRLFDVPRDGLYAGWNECLRRATGEWIYIATADDTCSLDLLEQMLAAHERAKQIVPEMNVGMVACDFDYIGHDGSILGQLPKHRPSDILGDWRNKAHARSRWVDLLMTLSVGISWGPYTSLLFRRELLDSAGLFRTDCGAAADRLWAAGSVLNSDLVWVPKRLATWRMHSSQASRGIPLATTHRVSREMRQFLVDIAGRLPPGWLQRDDWLERLSRSSTQTYHLALALDRLALRKHPRNFARGAWYTLRHDRAYLAHRIATGLGWVGENYKDGPTLWREMTRDFQVTWPPIALARNEDE